MQCMILFASLEVSTWVGIAASAIAAIVTIFTGLYALLKHLIDKKFDAQHITMEAKLEQQAKEIADLQDEVKSLNEKNDECERKQNELRKQVDELSRLLDDATKPKRR